MNSVYGMDLRWLDTPATASPVGSDEFSECATAGFECSVDRSGKHEYSSPDLHCSRPDPSIKRVVPDLTWGWILAGRDRSTYILELGIEVRKAPTSVRVAGRVRGGFLGDSSPDERPTGYQTLSLLRPRALLLRRDRHPLKPGQRAPVPVALLWPFGKAHPRELLAFGTVLVSTSTAAPLKDPAGSVLTDRAVDRSSAPHPFQVILRASASSTPSSSVPTHFPLPCNAHARGFVPQGGWPSASRTRRRPHMGPTSPCLDMRVV